MGSVDPDFELFWRKVAEAVQQVENSQTRTIELEQGNKRAEVEWNSGETPLSEYQSGEPHVAIRIYDVEPPQPALIVPG